MNEKNTLPAVALGTIYISLIVKGGGLRLFLILGRLFGIGFDRILLTYK